MDSIQGFLLKLDFPNLERVYYNSCEINNVIIKNSGNLYDVYV